MPSLRSFHITLIAIFTSLACAPDSSGPSPDSRPEITAPQFTSGLTAAAWTIKPRVPFGRASGVAVTVRDGSKSRIHFFGGFIYDDRIGSLVGVNRFDVFLPHVDRWGKQGRMPFGVYAMNGGELIEGKVYIPGGVTVFSQQVATMFIYDPAAEAWQTVPGPRLGAYGASGVIDGRLYVLTGWSDPVRDTAYFDRYDPATGVWSNLPNAPHAHLAGGAAVINGKFYSVGGVSDGHHTCNGDLDIYDPGSNSWTSLAPMPNPRSLMAVTVLNGKLYLFGGRECGLSGGPVTDVDIYDPSTDTWSTGAPMLNVREGAAVAVNHPLPGTTGAYVMGGSGQFFSLPVSANHLFDPTGTP